AQPSGRWPALADEMRRLRRKEDQFVYEPVFVGSFEDAFCAVIVNPRIAAVVTADDVPYRSRHDAPVLRSIIDPVIKADHGQASGIDLARAIKAMRPEVDLYMLSDRNVEALAGDPRADCVRRIFYAVEEPMEMHLAVLEGVAARYSTPFFENLKRYAQRPIGTFHALPIARGKSVFHSDWIRDMGEFYGINLFLAESSATTGGLDSLLEMLLLQADVLELKANPNAPASGPIVESRLDVGRGPVATMLVQRGTLKPGDAVVAGDAWGKVRIMLDEHGVKMTSAGPADPVEIVGFDKPPPAGEICRVVDSERDARHLAQRRAARLRAEELSRRSQKSISLEDLFKQVSDGKVRDLNLVIKGDVQGSVEAAVSELDKIKSEEVAVRVIHTGVGGITESDVMLAAASKAIVVGFNVRPNGEAKNLAEREGVDIRTYKIIYKLTEDIEAALVGMVTPDIIEEITGGAEVRQLFKASKIGTIAGCMVTSGLITRGSNVRVIRDGHRC
ncbi:MAG: hypothetical protein NTZ81_07610, partial [Actinobacteria bacterium]|nr:hypothetical protein [Actinomycetota bacterium]